MSVLARFRIRCAIRVAIASPWPGANHARTPGMPSTWTGSGSTILVGSTFPVLPAAGSKSVAYPARARASRE